MSITEDTIRGWLFVLLDEEPMKMLAAARYLCKTRDARHGPVSPQELVSTALRIEAPLEEAEGAWARGPLFLTNEFARNIWRLWGGGKRYGFLPDPQYAEDPSAAQREISFARREFLELWRAESSKNQNEQHRIAHHDASRLLGNLADRFAITSPQERPDDRRRALKAQAKLEINRR